MVRRIENVGRAEAANKAKRRPRFNCSSALFGLIQMGFSMARDSVERDR